MDDQGEEKADKPTCRYGSRCYRKNPEHLRRFAHPSPGADSAASEELQSVGSNGGTTEAAASTAPRGQRKRGRATEDEESSKEDTKRTRLKIDSSTTESEDHTQQSTTTSSDTEKQSSGGAQCSKRDDGIDKDELERDKTCADVREKVKRKFLVDFPEDFYQFWEFCSSLDPTHPEMALVSSVGLELVGSYHTLAGRLDGVGWDKCVLHGRYYYDPPEMVTVLRREGGQFHWGYFRDDPGRTDGCLIVSNDPSSGCELKIEAQNIFAAVKFEVDKAMKSGSIEHGQAERLRSLDRQLQQKMSELKLATTDGKTLTKQRGRDTVAKCFHKIGIVVPYDMKTEVGYRPLPKTNRELLKLLDSISKCQEPSKRDQLFEPLQEIITYVQFANDECDYGMGLELGLDLFCHGDSGFHGVVGHLLPLAYQLLGRCEYGRVVEQHLAQRQHTPLDFTTHL